MKKVIECGTQDRCASKEDKNLWHITGDKKTTLCGLNRLYLFIDPRELGELRKNQCPDCFKLAEVEGK